MLPHFLLDVIILALPVVEVSRLRLRMGQKIAIIALFLVGVMSVPGFILLAERLNTNLRGTVCVSHLSMV